MILNRNRHFSSGNEAILRTESGWHEDAIYRENLIFGTDLVNLNSIATPPHKGLYYITCRGLAIPAE